MITERIGGCWSRRLPFLFGWLPLLVAAGTAEATRTINSVSLNGGTAWTFNSGGAVVTTGSSVSLVAGGTLNVTMTVTGTGSGNADDWESTSYRISTSPPGTMTCSDTANFPPPSSPYTQTFSIIVPANSGTFNLYFRAHDGNSCTSPGSGNTLQSNLVTLKNSLTVQPPVTNPPLEEACGLDIVLVLDVSGSIGGNLGDVQNAAIDFIDAFLPGTPTLIGLVKFNDTATMLENLTNNTAALFADIAGLSSSGFTDWEEAILLAKGMLEGGLDRDDSVHPDLIVMVTDGDPTASTAGPNSTSDPNVHLAPAVVAANAAKSSSSSDPIRIVTVGVGAATQSRLIAISGPSVHPPDPISATIDVILGDFDELAEALGDLADAFCGGTITVHKIIDDDGNLGTTGDQSDGVGWTFTANPDAPDTSTPSSGPTDGMGMINFDIDLGVDATGIVDIIETLQSTHLFISASCVEGMSAVGTPGVNSVNNIPIGALDIISCTFYNKPRRGACCNTNIPGGLCTDDVEMADCQFPGSVFTENTLCSAVSCCSSNELCTDMDPCTTDTCVPGQGCVNTAIFCEDNDPCTNDACVNGSCKYHPVICPPNKDFCTDSACDPGGPNGNCNLTVPVNEGQLCDDLYYCTVGEICVSGTCGSGTPRDCEEGVDCTDDFCDEVNDVCVHVPDHSECESGDYCDGVQTCDPVLDCVDGPDPCSPPFKCDEANDRCVQCLSDAQCNDNVYCNGLETCNMVTGNCQGGANPCPADTVDCTIDGCDEGNDVCFHTPDDLYCQNLDGLYCNGYETCDPLLGCQDEADPCVFPFKCDEPNDRCVQCLSDGQCNDGLYCNGEETCNLVTGMCQPGANPCPADSVDCTIDGCNEDTNTCYHTPDHVYCQTLDGLYCNGLETCDPILGCQDSPDPCTLPMKCDEPNDRCVECLGDAWCNDGILCNGVETCDTVAGVCVPGTPACPDDGISCTTTICLEDDGIVCVHEDNCLDDEIYCNGYEFCDPISDSCVSSGDPCTPPQKCDEPNTRCVICTTNAQCNDGMYCNGEETCNTLDGVCVPGTPPCADDGVVCTTTVCIESTDTCTHVDNCTDDTLYCTGTEFCDPISNGCVSTGDPCTPPQKCDEPNDRCVFCTTHAQCNDGDFCNGEETCDVPNGTCLPGTPPCPSDAVVCTIELCNESTNMCEQVLDHASCQDALFCNGVEFCDPILDCEDGADPCGSDGIPCTADSCDETLDACIHTPDNTVCDDGLFCNGPEVCDPEVPGGCADGPDPCYSDGIDCTTEVCLEDIDKCRHVPDDDYCNDGNFCDGVEICDPVFGCVDTVPACPPDSIDCTVDFCNETTDMCEHNPDDAFCNNLLYCDGEETCDPLLGCVDGSLPCPPDAVDCTVDGCDEATDTCFHTPSDELCSDELFCTGEETCDPLLGCQDGADIDCSYLDSDCRVGACDEITAGCIQENTNEGGPCADDGLFCTGPEYCSGGECTSEGDPCPSGLKCDEANDRCVECLTAGQCEDNDRCTSNVCGPGGNCEFPENGLCGACCNNDYFGGGCEDLVTLEECQACPGGKCVWYSLLDCSDPQVECETNSIPTVSEWGLAMIALLLAIGGKLFFSRREESTTA